jgi:MoxR-like ATPase
MNLAFSEDINYLHQIRSNLESCIMGKEREVELLLTAALAGGHVLLEDVPGTGKTVLIKSLARSVQSRFQRIQCNPDLLPTDVTGVSIYHPKQEVFQFQPGPIFSNIVLIDEINRASTKTQSAFLEAMEERQVSVDGVCYPLPGPFLLLATQNPIDFDGTYTLPEAQMDRFMMKFRLGYPDHVNEKRLLLAQETVHPVDRIESVITIERLMQIQERVKRVYIDETIVDYIVSIMRSTREHPAVFLGASPRASVAMMQAAKARAYLSNRDFVIPDDIKELTPFVLGHRLILRPEAKLESEGIDSIIESILLQVRVSVGMGK